MAVPGVVAGQYHRAAIEALASRIAGHPVRIDGKIKLSLLPEPKLIADKVTIGAPAGAHTTAAVLKLDLNTRALLTGRLSASRLTLDHADIDLPWPVPGGAASLAPPPWLASLHAKLVDGQVHIGAFNLTHADLSFFTGGPHSVLAASGSARLAGRKVSLRFIFARIRNAKAHVQMSLGLADDKATSLHLKGTFGTDGALAGDLTASASAKAGRSLPVVDLLPKAPFHLTAQVEANRSMILLSDLTAQAGKATLGGQAAIDLLPAALLRVTLHGDSLDLDHGLALLRGKTLPIPVAAQFDLHDVSLAEVKADRLSGALTVDRHGTTLQSLAVDGPQGAHLDLSGTMNRAAHMEGRFRLSAKQAQPLAAWAATLTSQDVAAALGKLSLAKAPVGIHGRIDAAPDGLISVRDMQGTIGTGETRSGFMGSLAIDRSNRQRRVALGLDFRRLALREHDIEAIGRMIAAQRASLASAGPGKSKAPAKGNDGSKSDPDKNSAAKSKSHSAKPPKAVARPAPPATSETAAAAGRAPAFTLRVVASRLAILNLHRRLLGHNLLLDAEFGPTLAVHALGVSIGHALFLAHGTMTPQGTIRAARLVASGPDAAKTAAALATLTGDPPGHADTLINGPFAISADAEGRVNGLATHVAATIGTLRATARPVVDLGKASASGPVALQAPSAIEVLRKLGLAANADWPGAGSIGLNADAFVNPNAVGLSNFVLSFGATTGSGRLSLTRSGPPNLTGTLRFGTLALPDARRILALARTSLADTLDLHLKSISAGSVELAGTPVMKDAAFRLSLGQGKLSRALDLQLVHAASAGGKVSGDVTMTAKASSTPATLTVKAALDHVDAARLTHALGKSGVALPLRAGTVTLNADLDATGATPDQWLTSLSGTLAGSGDNLVVNGVDLAAAGKALGESLRVTHPRAALPAPHHLVVTLMQGSTGFSKGQLASTVRHGTIHINSFSMTGKSGQLGLAGDADLAKGALHLTAQATPSVTGEESAAGFAIHLTGRPASPERKVSAGQVGAWLRLLLAARQATQGPPPLPLPPPHVAEPAATQATLPLPPPHVAAPAAAGH